MGNSNKTLMSAIEQGRLEEIKKIYARNKSVFSQVFFCMRYNNKAFVLACKCGRIEIVQWIHSLGYVNIHVHDDIAFRLACRNGHAEIAQWIYSLGGANIRAHNDDAFILCCKHGRVEIARWIYSLGGVNVHACDDAAFRSVCESGHLEIAQWIYSLGDVYVHAHNDAAFHGACWNGHLKVAKWLHSLDVGIDVVYGGSIWMACVGGHIDVAKWLYSLDGVSVCLRESNTFVEFCEYGRLPIIQWLHSLHAQHRSEDVRDAFIAACEYDRLDIMQWLCSVYKPRGHNLNFCLSRVKENKLDLLQFLLQRGASFAFYSGASKRKIALLTRFSSWENKIGTHEILLQYVSKEDWCYLDIDAVQSILNKTKSAKTS